MIKFLQLKNLRLILSKCKAQEQQNQKEIHKLTQLDYQWKIFKIKDIQTYINNLEAGLLDIERQLTVLSQCILQVYLEKKTLRQGIQSAAVKKELLKQASHYFLELYNIDENLDYLQKHLQIVKFYSGTLSNEYISGLCQLTQITGDYTELELIYSQITKNKQSSLQKQVTMILFMHTSNEQYYEESLNYDVDITNHNLEIQFHKFAANYFGSVGCIHSQNFHLEQLHKCQSSLLENIQLSSISN